MNWGSMMTCLEVRDPPVLLMNAQVEGSKEEMKEIKISVEHFRVKIRNLLQGTSELGGKRRVMVGTKKKQIVKTKVFENAFVFSSTDHSTSASWPNLAQL